MPVGEAVMGRVFNVTGDAMDEQGPVKADKYCPIIALPDVAGSIHLAAGAHDRHQGH